MKKEKYNIKDYVGKKYAHLTIMSDVPLSDRIKKYALWRDKIPSVDDCTTEDVKREHTGRKVRKIKR